MKKKFKTILLLTAILLVVCFGATTLADTTTAAVDVTQVNATEALIEYGTRLLSSLIITLLGVFGTWLSIKLGQYAQLKNINAAQNDLIRAAKTTVGELRQTVVDDLKAAHADGKLTPQEISQLGTALLAQTKAKMSMPAYALLEAAQVDIDAMIIGVGENWINNLKQDVK